MSERWRTAVGYEGYYEVSDQGRVRSIPRKSSTNRKIGGNVLETSNFRGYRKMLANNGSKRRKCVFVHHLIANTFIGPRPTSNHQINHINGIKHDNRVANLEWVTPLENIRHSIEVLGNSIVGERNPASKITGEIAREIVRRVRSGECGIDIADDYGIAPDHVSHIITGRVWSRDTGITKGNYQRNESHPGRFRRFESRAKLTHDQVREIRNHLKHGVSRKSLSKKYGVGATSILNIANGNSWNHVK